MKKILDYLWVFQAFLRGRVLCQESYRPILYLNGKYSFDGLVSPRFLRGVTINRVSLLARWWGFHEARQDELCDFRTIWGVNEWQGKKYRRTLLVDQNGESAFQWFAR